MTNAPVSGLQELHGAGVEVQVEGGADSGERNGRFKFKLQLRPITKTNNRLLIPSAKGDGLQHAINPACVNKLRRFGADE